MRFLFRMIFWFGVVLVLLPSVGSRNNPSSDVSAGDAVSAAKATVTDVRSFCERQRDACTIGSQAAAVLGHRAQAGAKMVYDYLTEHFGEGESSSSSGSDKSFHRPASAAGHDTLRPADLTPAWRGARPAKETRSARSSPSG